MINCRYLKLLDYIRQKLYEIRPNAMERNIQVFLQIMFACTAVGLLPSLLRATESKQVTKCSAVLDDMKLNSIQCPTCKKEPNVQLAVAKDYEYQSSDRSFEYSACEGCGSVMLTSPISRGELGNAYPENYYSYHLLKNYDAYKNSVEGKRYFAEWRDAVAKDLTEEFLEKIGTTKAKARILDVGGGDGLFLEILTQVGFQEKNLFLFDELAPVKHSTQTFDPRTASPGQFDIIFANQVVEHMEAPEALFELAEKHLKKGGVLVLEAPSPTGIHFQLTKSGVWGGYHAPRHLYLLTPDSLQKLGEQNGLNLIESKYADDSWIWLQTLNNISKKYPATQTVLGKLSPAFATGIKEEPSRLRRQVLAAFNRVNRVLKKIKSPTSAVKMVFKK